MLNKALVYVMAFWEKAGEDGFLKTLGQSIYSCQEAVPVYCDLANLKPEKHPLEKFGCEIRHITQIDQVRDLPYAQKSRKFKVKMNVRKGYQAFILVRQDRVIGDIWFTRAEAPRSRPHQDLELLAIDLSPQDAYAFDLQVAKRERGKDLTTSFMTSGLRKLKEMGFSRAYGYYMAKNIPALWIHRLIGYKELPKIRIRSCLRRRRSLPPVDRPAQRSE